MSDDDALDQLDFTPNIRCEANPSCVRAAGSFIQGACGCPCGAVCQPCLERLQREQLWGPVICTQCGRRYRTFAESFRVIGLVSP